MLERVETKKKTKVEKLQTSAIFVSIFFKNILQLTSRIDCLNSKCQSQMWYFITAKIGVWAVKLLKLGWVFFLPFVCVCVCASQRPRRGTYRPLGGQGLQSHWMFGGGTPWDVQWIAWALPRGTERCSRDDTAFSPIWGATVKNRPPQTHNPSYHHVIVSRTAANHWGGYVSHRSPPA